MASTPRIYIDTVIEVDEEPLSIQQCLTELLDDMTLVRRATTPSDPAAKDARRRRAVARSRARVPYGD